MPVKHYGVWVGRPTSFTSDPATDPTPHINLKFKDDLDGRLERSAAINVRSSGPDSRLVYWLVRDFTHPITDTLKDLPFGFRLIRPDDADATNLGLDYVRTAPQLLDISQGRVLPDRAPGQDNDILDELVPILQSAIDKEADIYLFGSSFGSGIHEIHMNQGSLPRFDNGVFQDGGIILHFSSDNSWQAVFLAFASQRIPTDDETGLSLDNSEALSELVQQG